MLALSACMSPPKAPVHERNILTLKAEMDHVGGALIRIIQPGDTLHGIAFAFDLDVNQLAAWNGMFDTSKLRVGQRVRLTEPLNFKATLANNKTRSSTIASGSSKSSQSLQRPLPPKKKVITNKPKMSLAAKHVAWHWPTAGPVVAHFSLANGKQGIDIKGKFGQKVLAASTGEVVYVGNALKGYGNLVIIKHNQYFLSAYAFNREIFVKEGQVVAKNHLIATMGVDKLRRNVLHFQIRGNGKALNPLNFLPKR